MIQGDGAPAEEVERLKAASRAALAQHAGELVVDGLRERVEVLRDAWGVPHIYARNAPDLFFAQGFVQAQDRLWQMEVWRRDAEGRLSEIGGPPWVARDRLARLIRYRGDPEAEWAAYGPGTKAIVESFVAGVNACIEACSASLPIEFQLMGVKPEPWTPSVVLGRMAGFIMCRNASNEIMRSLLVQEIGFEETMKLLPISPVRELAEQPAAHVKGLEGLLKLFASLSLPIRMLLPSPASVAVPVGAESGEDTSAGSNNWVIAGRLSETGMPILANDPHRQITLPSLRYVVHLVCPPDATSAGWNVIGGSEPAVPGVTIGHNDRIAWGITIVSTDQQDLYVEEIHPEDDTRYRAGDDWVPFEIEQEALRVRGESAPRLLWLKFSRHGPVIHEDLEARRAIALRWAGSEPGGAGYLSSLAVDQARDWPSFLEAAGRWNVPSSNLVYADVEGHIGWIAAALTPVREGWDGLMPVPGAGGEHEWAGYLATSQLPQAFDPDQGYIATANSNILPAGYAEKIAFDWTAPFRFERIDEVLQAGERFSVEGSKALQHDATSMPARRLIALLRQAEIKDEGARPAAELLLGWDCVLGRDSAAAALYKMWMAQLVEAVIRPRVPGSVWPVYANRAHAEVLLGLLEQPDARFGAEPFAGRDAVLVEALGRAVGEVSARLGPDVAGWQWGMLHRAHFRHMLSPAAAPAGTATEAMQAALAAVFDLPSMARDGDADTPLATSGPGFDQTGGASYCQVIDLGDWDASFAKNAPGQSGQPESPYYGNLLEAWRDGDYFPLSYSREAVEAAAQERLLLVPGGGKP